MGTQHTLKPMKAKTLKQICDLQTDHTEVGDYYLAIDTGVVYLSEQGWGESPTERMEIARDAFDKMIRWYVTGSKCGRLA